MKHTIALLLLLAFIACKQKTASEGEEMTTAEDTNTTAFEPKPQFISEQEVTVLELGAKAPDFNLPGVDGKFHTLDEYEDADVLVIIFTCNHCPTAQAYEERMIEIVNDYQGKGVQLIAISPNNPLGLLYEELGYTDLNDDYEAMILRAA